jgi:hypothetical protein
MDRERREVEDHRSRERGFGNNGGGYWSGGRDDRRSGAAQRVMMAEVDLTCMTEGDPDRVPGSAVESRGGEC